MLIQLNFDLMRQTKSNQTLIDGLIGWFDPIFKTLFILQSQTHALQEEIKWYALNSGSTLMFLRLIIIFIIIV